MELTFDFINMQTDRPLIKKWEEEYKDTEGMKAIRHFVLEDDTYYSLYELIWTNTDLVPIGDDEIRKTLVAKTEDGEVAGFLIYNVFNMNYKPEVALIYIAVNPTMQHKGVGTAMHTELFSNPEKYFKCAPHIVFAKIDTENIASQKFCKNFGFKMLPQKDESCLRGFQTSYENIMDHINEMGNK